MNVIREAMAAGRPTFGVAQSFPDPQLSESLGAASLYDVGTGQSGANGFEWAWLDTQHSGMTWSNLLPIMQALELSGIPSVVRVGWNDPRLIMRALDLGAIAVVTPMISTADEARRAAEAMRYPPDGNRSFGPLRKVAAPSQANKDVVYFPMVETTEGVENLEEIASVPGVDGIFIGPMDLAIDMNLEPKFDELHPRVLEVIDQTVSVCRSRNLIPGTITLHHENAEDLLERGMRFLIIGNDASYVRAGISRDVPKMNQWIQRFQRDASAV